MSMQHDSPFAQPRFFESGAARVLPGIRGA